MLTLTHFEGYSPRVAPHKTTAVMNNASVASANTSQWKEPVSTDVFQTSPKLTLQPSAALRFGAGNFKQLVKEFKKIDSSTVGEQDRPKKTAEFALKLFKTCPTEPELTNFAKQVGIVIHYVDENSPMGQWMKNDGAQGYAIYPNSKISGLSPAVLQDLSQKGKKEPGFEIMAECEQNKKPLILILNNIQNKDFSLYVLQHELFHIIQNTMGHHGLTSANYENESLASGWHLDLLKKLRNKNSDAAKEIIKKAESYRNLPEPQNADNTFGQGLRQITGLDLQTYHFFCEHAGALKLPPWIKQHNENLKAVYQTIKFYSFAPDLNTGLSSVEMRRS